MPFPRTVQAHRHSRLTAVLALLAASAGAACSAAINPQAIEDARTVVRIRSVLVNEPALGTRPVEVRVTGGTARLTGRVYSEAEAERLVLLVRGVEGVVAVTSDVQVVAAPPTETPIAVPVGDGNTTDAADRRRLFAIGVSLNNSDPRAATLDRRFSIGAIVRIGSGRGLAPTIAFNWITTELFAAGHRPSRSLGHVRIRPVMGGIGYTWRGARMSATASLVAGYAFNALRIGDVVPDGELALRVDNSFAWRPGLSIWYDINDRFAVNGFGGYLVTRPRAAFLVGNAVETRTLHVDASIVSIGLVYKVF